jgi:GR25 family glycosyltransferase involved in LPS biosynthesis
LFNNVPQIPCGPGGAGGQHAKVEFYKQYKFALVCENSSDTGYVTEKLLHAKMAGCVPIYWGDPEVHLEFNVDGFINATGLEHGELLKQIAKLDTNVDAWAKIAAVPLLTEARIKEYGKIWDALAQATVAVSEIKMPGGGGGVAGTVAGTAAGGSAVGPVASSASPELPPYKAEKLSDNSGRVIITCCTKHTVDATKSLIRRVGPLYVWAWDISHDEKLQLEAAGAKRVLLLDTSWNPGWADFWKHSHTGWKALCLVVSDASFAQGTQIVYMDYGYIGTDMPAVWNRLNLEQIYAGDRIMDTWGHQFCAATGLSDLEAQAPMYSTDIIGFTAGGKYASLFTGLLGLCVKPELITLDRGWHKLLNLLFLRTKISGNVGRGFDAAYIINLAHRQDRLEKFKNSHPYMDTICNREPAVYGNTLALTAELAHLFRANDFKWKKGVMGVALSHYNIWKRLRTGSDRSYLVFEDDAVLCKDFMNVWAEKARFLPLDTDIVFLGGVLPPNMKALPLVTDAVNAHFARVKPHSLFGGPERRYFHFCAYSYYITKAGAAKLCALIEEKGIFTSIDHMMVNHGDKLLNIYFTTPLIAGCFQDADPNYQNADFNNFNRVDKFDTEIWNNVEAFKPEEIAAVTSSVAISTGPAAAGELINSSGENTMIYFAPTQSNTSMESDWLDEIFGKKFVWKESSEDVHGRVFIFYQHVVSAAVVEGWINRHMDCEIFLIHCSDEQCKADISIYNHPGIKHVFRNYWRPEAVGKKVTHLPLGYMNGRGGSGLVVPINVRPNTWSFAGALDRPGRTQIIDSLRREVPACFVHTTPTWMSPLNLGEKMYIDTLRDAKFVPCLNGFWNVESYRFYEALEHGAIPIFGLDEKQSYINMLSGSTNAPLFGLQDWAGAGAVMNNINSRPEVLEKIQKDMTNWWFGYKIYLKHAVAAALV